MPSVFLRQHSSTSANMKTYVVPYTVFYLLEPKNEMDTVVPNNLPKQNHLYGMPTPHPKSQNNETLQHPKTCFSIRANSCPVIPLDFR